MKRVFSALLAALCLAAAATTVHAAPLQAVNPQWSEEKQQVKAPAWNMTAEAIAAGKVQLNWAVCTKAAAEVAQGDTISLRGLGKCCVEEVGNQTKKGRIFVSIKRYL